ncbi:hypothetical protein K439DRAFT_1618713 [Ramaria rubella]|nr:hypothetical protein K439DRAFT_1618713 [Ramaria rubella]
MSSYAPGPTVQPPHIRGPEHATTPMLPSYNTPSRLNCLQQQQQQPPVTPRTSYTSMAVRAPTQPCAFVPMPLGFRLPYTPGTTVQPTHPDTCMHGCMPPPPHHRLATLDYLQPGSTPPSTAPVDPHKTPLPADHEPHHSYAHTLLLPLP